MPCRQWSCRLADSWSLSVMSGGVCEIPGVFTDSCIIILTRVSRGQGMAMVCTVCGCIFVRECVFVCACAPSFFMGPKISISNLILYMPLKLLYELLVARGKFMLIMWLKKKVKGQGYRYGLGA